MISEGDCKHFTTTREQRLYIAQLYRLWKIRIVLSHTVLQQYNIVVQMYLGDSGYVPKTVEIRVYAQSASSMETNVDFGCRFCLCSTATSQDHDLGLQCIMELRTLWFHVTETEEDYKYLSSVKLYN